MSVEQVSVSDRLPEGFEENVAAFMVKDFELGFSRSGLERPKDQYAVFNFYRAAAAGVAELIGDTVDGEVEDVSSVLDAGKAVDLKKAAQNDGILVMPTKDKEGKPVVAVLHDFRRYEGEWTASVAAFHLLTEGNAREVEVSRYDVHLGKRSKMRISEDEAKFVSLEEQVDDSKYQTVFMIGGVVAGVVFGGWVVYKNLRKSE